MNYYIKSLFKYLDIYLLNEISLALLTTITTIHYLSHSIFPTNTYVHRSISQTYHHTVPPSHQFSFYFPIILYINILCIRIKFRRKTSNPLSISPLYSTTTINDFPCDPIFFFQLQLRLLMFKLKLQNKGWKKNGSMLTHATYTLSHSYHRKFHVPGDDTIDSTYTLHPINNIIKCHHLSRSSSFNFHRICYSKHSVITYFSLCDVHITREERPFFSID